MKVQEKQEQYTTNAAAMIRAIDNTGIRMFMYFPQTKTITVPEKTCADYLCKPVYTNMPHSFADDYVHQDDYKLFKEMYYKIDRGEKTATATFHSKDLNYCNHVTLTTVSWTEDGLPDEVFGLIEDMSDAYKNEQFIKKLQEELATNSTDEETDDALKTIAASIGSQYYAVYYIYLENHNYICFQEQLRGILSVIGERGNCHPAWDIYIENYVEEQDKKIMREFVDISTLAERLGDKNSITHNYRRKEVGWTRGQFIVGKRDADGKILTVIYTVADINEEMETKRKKYEAEQEALHDSLTKMWNRKAFEYYKETAEYKNNQVGFMLFDIDRFKGINDQFGHEIGDKVITVVANQVKNALRQNDRLFRIGGDEFAVLLSDCDESIWNSVCRKIEQIHIDVKEILSKDINVTLSVGLCVNKTGFRDEMYKLADRAMYNTKANGRGGCTLIDLQGEILKEWHDKSRYLRKGDVLERNSTMTWRVEVPKTEGLPTRAYADDLLMTFLGVDQMASPQDVFQAWKKRIEPDYLDIIKKATKAAISEGKSEAVYLWNHPEKGVVQLRGSTSLEAETDAYYSFLGYIHIITDTHVFTLENVSDTIKNAL